MHPDSVFVTGIGTGVGKTMVSAILCAGLKACYWKPIQAGLYPTTDTKTVQELSGLNASFFLKEFKILQAPISPHAAAEQEGIRIELADLKIPDLTTHPIVIEGAGGLLVPINYESTFADLLKIWNIPVVVVVQHYLGSINHTLLTLECLFNRGIPIKGIILNGKENLQSERVISSYSGIEIIGKVPFCDAPNPEWIQDAFNKYIFWGK